MIQRFPEGRLGRCSSVVADGYVYAVTTDPKTADNITDQTRNALEELDRVLERSGSGKRGMLQATVYLTDMANKTAMDAVWIDWIGPEDHWPQRACVGVDLAPGDMIEIVVTAKVL
ncbi:MAG: RidA family protein [Paracoccaceae bacterium]